MLKLSQLENLLEQGRGLQDRLREADRTIAAFEKIQGDTVRCIAVTEDPERGVRYGARLQVDVLPVSKSAAIGAAKRDRFKIVQQLADLGIEVDAPREKTSGEVIDEMTANRATGAALIERGIAPYRDAVLDRCPERDQARAARGHEALAAEVKPAVIGLAVVDLMNERGRGDALANNFGSR